jgi:hypothetical protein
MPSQILNWLSFTYRRSAKPGVIQYIYNVRIGRVQNSQRKSVWLYVAQYQLTCMRHIHCIRWLATQRAAVRLPAGTAVRLIGALCRAAGPHQERRNGRQYTAPGHRRGLLCNVATAGIVTCGKLNIVVWMEDGATKTMFPLPSVNEMMCTGPGNLRQKTVQYAVHIKRWVFKNESDVIG